MNSITRSILAHKNYGEFFQNYTAVLIVGAQTTNIGPKQPISLNIYSHIFLAHKFLSLNCLAANRHGIRASAMIRCETFIAHNKPQIHIQVAVRPRHHRFVQLSLCLIIFRSYQFN